MTVTTKDSNLLIPEDVPFTVNAYMPASFGSIE